MSSKACSNGDVRPITLKSAGSLSSRVASTFQCLSPRAIRSLYLLPTLLSEKSVTHAPPLGNLLAIQISAIGIGRWILFLFSFSCSIGGCRRQIQRFSCLDIVHDYFSNHKTLINRVACPLTHSLIAYPLCSIVQALSSSLEFFSALKPRL